MRPVVLVTSYYDPAATDDAMKRLGPVADVRRVDARTWSRDELIEALAGVEVAIVSGEPFDETVFAAAPSLRMICCDGAGVDHIDLEAATRHGVIVTNAPVVHEANADFVMGLIIAAMRRLLLADRGVRAGQWNARSQYLGRDVHGSTLGLLGFGRVAKAVARRAAGFDMKVLARSPNADRNAARQLGVDVVSFDELLARCDILSIHVPLNQQTRGLIGAAEIAKMKRGAFLINTSRGAIINESALVDALRSGKLAGAALDVLDPEPPEPRNPLLTLENVILSPHIGSDTAGTFARVFECVVQDILLYFSGRPPIHRVNQITAAHVAGR